MMKEGNVSSGWVFYHDMKEVKGAVVSILDLAYSVLFTHHNNELSNPTKSPAIGGVP